MQVGDGGARRAHHRGPGATLRQSQREEAGGALVDPGVQPEQAGLGGVEGREGQRRVP
jgi:hypothetical protein